LTKSEHPAVKDQTAAGCSVFIVLTFRLKFFMDSSSGRSRLETPEMLTAESIPGRRIIVMDAHFYFSLALILFVFFLCFRFRKENRKK